MLLCSLQSTCPAPFFMFVLPVFASSLFRFPFFCLYLQLSCRGFFPFLLFPYCHCFAIPTPYLQLSWVFSHFFFSSIVVLTPFTLSLLWACFLNFRFVLHLLFFLQLCVHCLFTLFSFGFCSWVFVLLPVV
ncbi:hypothetical protein JHK87_053224 [Glycine soja]|nr:hypothetical protein JHK87_053224 [Glycine soja]